MLKNSNTCDFFPSLLLLYLGIKEHLLRVEKCAVVVPGSVWDAFRFLLKTT